MDSESKFGLFFSCPETVGIEKLLWSAFGITALVVKTPVAFVEALGCFIPDYVFFDYSATLDQVVLYDAINGLNLVYPGSGYIALTNTKAQRVECKRRGVVYIEYPVTLLDLELALTQVKKGPGLLF